jgi:glycosyltransferase involved in cell wall biosynthesis
MQSVSYAPGWAIRDPIVLHLPGRLRKSRRILQVVGSMDRGGIETWLMHVLRHINRDRFEVDFLVHSDHPGAYDPEIRALGSHVITCPGPERPWQYAYQFRRILEDHGPYDVVHSHVHQFSGFILRLARSVGVPCRIAHSHLDAASAEAEASWSRQAYLGLMHHWLQRHATHGLCASRVAAADLFGERWQSDRRWRIHYCSIDLDPFFQPVVGNLRAELGLAADSQIVGHVGRLTPQKNHDFLLRFVAVALTQRPNLHLVLVGQGELEPEIRQQIACLDAGLDTRIQGDLRSRIHLLPPRSDIPDLLRQFNAFCFPSHYEGLPLTLIEAQAAGLPCLISSAITHEVDIVPGLVQRLSLEDDLDLWADRLLCQLDRPRDATAIRCVVQSPFNIRNGISRLEGLYASV